VRAATFRGRRDAHDASWEGADAGVVEARRPPLPFPTVDDGDAEPVTAVRAIDGLRITRFG
jgi:hypothetical protein